MLGLVYDTTVTDKLGQPLYELEVREDFEVKVGLILTKGKQKKRVPKRVTNNFFDWSYSLNYFLPYLGWLKREESTAICKHFLQNPSV